MINQDNLINDGLNYTTCENNGTSVVIAREPTFCCFSSHTLRSGQATWTYNQGVIFGGLALAAKKHPADAARYSALAVSIFDAVRKHMTTPTGVLLEPLPGNPYNDGDQFIFKGIFVRYLAYAVRDGLIAGNAATAIATFLDTQIDSVAQNDQTASGLFGVFWQGPITARFNNITAATQFSAFDLFLAKSGLPK